MSIRPQHNILIVTGPAGCGKSTVAKFLAERYGFYYIEGDDVRQSNTLDSGVTDKCIVPPSRQH